MYWFLFISIAILSYAVQINLQRKFAKFSKIRIANGMTGAEVAAKMLSDHGITNVRITHVPGQLTDNFNPQTMTLNLSDSVYGTCSVAAAAVAAHECGHAVQHARGYAPLRLRSAMVPAVSFASRAVTWVILIGMILIKAFPGIMLFGIGLFALTALFSIITLPVEVNASQRATEWLNRAGITDYSNHEYACQALHSAAYTYVVSALSSIGTLVYYILIYTNRR